jgi:acetyl esterase/lipase
MKPGVTTILRAIGWLVAAVATIGVWVASAEKTTEPALPPGVAVVRNLTYRVVDGRPLALDLYLPTAPAPILRPALVAIHGGSWVGGLRREYGTQAARFAEHGFVAAAVDYRLARPGAPSWDGALEDVAAAVDWLAEQVEEYGVDPDRIAAFGTSAGGLLAAHLARDDLAFRGTKPTTRIRAAVCLSTPASLYPLASARRLAHDPVSSLVGGAAGDFDHRAEDASPINHVTPGWHPVLLIHGTYDLWVSVNQAREMRDKLDKMRVPNRLIEIEGARHGFELQIGAPEPRDLLPDVLHFLGESLQIRGSAGP